MTLVAHKYMPGEMSEDELRRSFAVREHTLDYLVEELRAQTGKQSFTSYLITGPRGAGKTTLVLMLALRTREDAALAAAWHPVRFPEELPGVTSLRDFLAATLRAMSDDCDEDAAERFAAVEAEPDDDASLELAVRSLQERAAALGRTLLLLVENLDQVLGEFDDRDLAHLRRLLMNDPFLVVVGTAVRMFEEVQAYDQPLFNYFCPVPLKRLDHDEVRALLLRRAEVDGHEGFEDRYRANRPEIKALSEMTGGNPRLAILLYEVLATGDIASVVDTLRQLVDELTPLLKDVLEHQLPGQQRKIVDAIMRDNGVSTPKAIANRTRLPLGSVTKQLGRLKDAQILELRGGGKGKPAYYAIADPLFSTWYQMRYLRPNRRRIELIVELLRSQFREDELLSQLEIAVIRGSSLATVDHLAASLRGTTVEALAVAEAVVPYLERGHLADALSLWWEHSDLSRFTMLAATTYRFFGGRAVRACGKIAMDLDRLPDNDTCRVLLDLHGLSRGQDLYDGSGPSVRRLASGVAHFLTGHYRLALSRLDLSRSGSMIAWAYGLVAAWPDTDAMRELLEEFRGLGPAFLRLLTEPVAERCEPRAWSSALQAWRSVGFPTVGAFEAVATAIETGKSVVLAGLPPAEIGLTRTLAAELGLRHEERHRS